MVILAQICLKYKQLSKFHGKPQIPVYDSSDPFVLDLCLYIEDATNLIIIMYICILPKKRPVLVSAHAHNCCHWWQVADAAVARFTVAAVMLHDHYWPLLTIHTSTVPRPLYNGLNRFLYSS